jgi:predicted transcriptional regulator
MTPNEWAGLAVAITTLAGTLAMTVRHLVKHYLSELRPNGGSSVKDKINSLEEKVELLTDLVKELIKR